jgi:two-component system, chemotaxis family, chemotaxis protein CheY
MSEYISQRLSAIARYQYPTVEEEKRMKALIVEDELTNRMIMKKFLSPYGECDFVVDGNEAIQAFKMAWEENKPYNLICMDIMMPKMNGHEAMRKIRELEVQLGIKVNNKAVIIMTTSRADSDDIKNALEAKVAWYLLKPIDREKLLHKLRELNVI